MASIRSKLTLAYAAALGATIVAFGVALYVARGAGSQAVLERVARSHAELATLVLRQAAYERGPLVDTHHRRAEAAAA